MTTEPKPAILCLHGHGSNGAIFRTQCQQLSNALSPHFRLLFLNSPITTPQAGVGVHPHYAHIKPYRRWHQDPNTIGLFDVTAEDVERERRIVRESLKEVIERERASGSAVVGVMGFSQGTRVAVAVCLDPELGRNIKFAIMVCGIGPELSLGTASGLGSPGNAGAPRPSLDIVSVHVQGSADPWSAKGTRLMRQYFNPGLATVVRFQGGHEIPVKTGDVQRIAAVMAECWGYGSVPDVEVADAHEVTPKMVAV
ncbi:hypothetical protein BDW74DRAFT_180480 [Aspergillus multicolor]|uniref:putative oxidoreductase n=1 Tax=Aspergillus multicolor TaxID=41759 RepID=UPI003CCD1EF5